jgi:hypothetical protein
MKTNLVSILALFGLVGCAGAAEPEFNPQRVLSRPLPAITNAPHVPADAARPELVHDAELVLGVVVNSEARAYPINMLTGPQREIINDILGGERIAATW